MFNDEKLALNLSIIFATKYPRCAKLTNKTLFCAFGTMPLIARLRLKAGLKGGEGGWAINSFLHDFFRVKTLSDICFRPGDSNKELTRNYKKPKNTTLILGPSGIGRKGVCFCRLSSIRKLTSAVSFIILIPRNLNLGRRASPIMLSFYLGEKMTLPL